MKWGSFERHYLGTVHGNATVGVMYEERFCGIYRALLQKQLGSFAKEMGLFSEVLPGCHCSWQSQCQRA